VEVSSNGRMSVKLAHTFFSWLFTSFWVLFNALVNNNYLVINIYIGTYIELLC
jgi:hypothetical protein